MPSSSARRTHARAGRPVQLGEHLDRFPPYAGQREPEHLLRPGVRVRVRGVERGDPGVERGPGAGQRLLLVDLRAVRDPVPVRDLADLQAAAAEPAMEHQSCPLVAVVWAPQGGIWERFQSAV